MVRNVNFFLIIYNALKEYTRIPPEIHALLSRPVDQSQAAKSVPALDKSTTMGAPASFNITGAQ
jgi:NADH:ubiquinone oxidoreductase subunit